MATGGPETRQPIKRAWLAALGLVVTLASPVPWFLLIDNAWVLRTAAPSFLVMGVGLAIGAAAVLQDRRARVKTLAVLNVAVVGLFLYGFFVLSLLPAQADQITDASAIRFTLPDQHGQPVSVAKASASGPVLLVFYRGFW